MQAITAAVAPVYSSGGGGGGAAATMAATTTTGGGYDAAAAAAVAATPLYADWMRMYTRRPCENSSLFELEAMVAKRMELLAWIDQMSESAQTRSYDAMLDAIAARLPAERRARPGRVVCGGGGGALQLQSSSTPPRHGGAVAGAAVAPTILGYDAGVDEDKSARRQQSRSRSRGDSAAASSSPWGSDHGSAFAITFDASEDLISHLLCRYAFCTSERWRKWLVKTEELLLRARMRLEVAKRPFTFMTELMTYNGLPCRALTPEEAADACVREYVEYRAATSSSFSSSSLYGGGGSTSSGGDVAGIGSGGATAVLLSSAVSGGTSSKESEGKMENYYSVPLSLATRLIRARKVLCHGGRAILFRDQVQEVFVVVFRAQLQRGLHAAYTERMQLLQYESESAKDTIMAMLDAFLEHFVRDPASAMAEQASGAVAVGDVPRLAALHFPPCMRQVDAHLRRCGHLKHHGRFTYGLFLKAIGLSLEHALTLFATLMTEKGGGGGDVDAFARTAYGYNIRHNYGLEGKKTSYSSASCATLLALPPMVDKYDCHGCPFRFRDEAALRALLLQQRARGKRNTLSAAAATTTTGAAAAAADIDDVHEVSLADIEDMVSDCKGQHYTRACYKYFMATHPGARRDTLFRSPYEYYCASREHEQQQQQQQQHEGAVEAHRLSSGSGSSSVAVGAIGRRSGSDATGIALTPSPQRLTPGKRTMLTPARYSDHSGVGGGDDDGGQGDATRRRLE